MATSLDTITLGLGFLLIWGPQQQGSTYTVAKRLLKHVNWNISTVESGTYFQHVGLGLPGPKFPDALVSRGWAVSAARSR